MRLDGRWLTVYRRTPCVLIPQMYRQWCERCDGEPQDGQRRGRAIPYGQVRYLDSSNTLVEYGGAGNQTLRQLGDSALSATFGGRLFEMGKLICRQCGTINNAPQLHTMTSVGCLAGLVLYVAIYVFLLVAGLPNVLAWILALVAAVLPHRLLTRRLTKRYDDRIRELHFERCQQCGSTDAVSLDKVATERLNCPTCNHDTLEITLDSPKVVPQFSLRSFFVLTTIIALAVGLFAWGKKRYADIKLECVTAQEANKALRGFTVLPDGATDVDLDHRPFSTATIRFKLPIDEMEAWCKKNNWTIDAKTRSDRFLKFKTPRGGGNWHRGKVIFVIVEH